MTIRRHGRAGSVLAPRVPPFSRAASSAPPPGPPCLRVYLSERRARSAVCPTRASLPAAVPWRASPIHVRTVARAVEAVPIKAPTLPMPGSADPAAGFGCLRPGRPRYASLPLVFLNLSLSLLVSVYLSPRRRRTRGWLLSIDRSTGRTRGWLLRIL